MGQSSPISTALRSISGVQAVMQTEHSDRESRS